MRQCLFVIAACCGFFVYGMSHAQTVVIPPVYDEVRVFSEHLAAVRVKQQWGYIDLKGDLVIPVTYEDAGNFQEGLAPVKTASGWGYIHPDGTWAIPAQYKGAKSFSEGLAEVKVRTLADRNDDDTLACWGYIDKSGNLVCKYYYHTNPFKSGVAIVEMNGRGNVDHPFSLIDQRGRVLDYEKYEGGVWEYDAYWWKEKPGLFFPFGLFPKTGGFLEGECGYTDKEGRWVIEPEYHRVSPFDNQGFAVVEAYGAEYFLIDTEGKKITSMGFQLDGSYLGNGFYLKAEKVYHVSNTDAPYYDATSAPFSFRCQYVAFYGEGPRAVGMSGGPTDIAGIQDAKLDRHYVPSELSHPSDGLWLTRFVDTNNKSQDKYGFVSLRVSDYLKVYIQSKLDEWQMRGEFESVSAWRSRTSDRQKEKNVLTWAEELMGDLYARNMPEWSLSEYDLDNRTYLVETELGRFVISLDKSKAQTVKNQWDTLGKRIHFTYDNGLKVSRIELLPKVGAPIDCPISPRSRYVAADSSVHYSDTDVVSVL